MADLPPIPPTARPMFPGLPRVPPGLTRPGLVPAACVPGPGQRPPVALDAAGRIDADLQCRSCGYNLRGLLLDGRCPECATAVGRSIHGDVLQFCDPAWVRTLASGMNWIIAGIVASLLLGIAGSVVTAMARSSGTNLGRATIFSSLAAIISLVGYWKVTTRDPAQPDATGLDLRQLVRITQVGSVGLGLMLQVLREKSSVLAVSAVAVGGLCGLVGNFAVFLYARRIARRIPDDELARRTTFVMWGWCSVLALGFAFGVLAAILVSATPRTAGGGPAGPVMVLLGGMGCFVGLGSLVFGLWSLRLIQRYRTAMRDAADMAAATWAATPAGQ